MIIGDERIEPLKERLLAKRGDIIIMDSEGTPIEDIKQWLLHDDNASLLPTSLVYIMAGVWNLVAPHHFIPPVSVTPRQGIKLITKNSPTADPPIIICEKQYTDTILKVEAKYPHLKVIICPIIGMHTQGYNEHKGVHRGVEVEVEEQQVLNDQLIDLNNIIQRINAGRSLSTPRYDRNYFHYDCRTKSHRVYYPKLDKVSFSVSDESFSIQIADKICSSIESNL